MMIIPNNLFSARDYVLSDPKTGLLSTPSGKRLIAVPDVLLDSIYQTLMEEAGQASVLALYTFGLGWGKSFFERTKKETESYYQTPIKQLNGIEFFATVQEIWYVHGLGKVSIGFNQAEQGILIVTIVNSGICKLSLESNTNSFRLESGFLAGWFSGLTQRTLGAYATSWHIETNRIEYIIADSEHIAEIQAKSVA